MSGRKSECVRGGSACDEYSSWRRQEISFCVSSADDERRAGSACSAGSNVRTILWDVSSLNLWSYPTAGSDIEPLQISIYLRREMGNYLVEHVNFLESKVEYIQFYTMILSFGDVS